MLRQVTVFFYGLFMDADLLRARGLQPANLRRGSVPGFSLRIGTRATLVPDVDGRAYSILMDLSHDEIHRLYAEPSVQLYRPEAVIAELDDGVRLPCLCFNLATPPGRHERDEGYVKQLRDLARRLGLPGEYVKALE